MDTLFLRVLFYVLLAAPALLSQEGNPPFTPPLAEEVPVQSPPVPAPEPAPEPVVLPSASEVTPAIPTPLPTSTPTPTPVSLIEKIKEALTPESQPSVVLKEFATLPPRIQELILAAFRLEKQNLSYKFGAADPSKGGMDCSGTVYYLLRELGWKNVPRQSDAFYRWVWEAEQFVAVNGTTFSSYEWKKLKPGDLLFWTGTYTVSKDRDPAISHVMIYLGVDEKTGRRLMFGASEGRRYQDKTRSGVGLFDFSLPVMGKTTNGRQPRFIGYGRIPNPSEPKISQATNP